MSRYLYKFVHKLAHYKNPVMYIIFVWGSFGYFAKHTFDLVREKPTQIRGTKIRQDTSYKCVYCPR